MVRLTSTLNNVGNTQISINYTAQRLQLIAPVRGALQEDLLERDDIVEESLGRVVWPSLGATRRPKISKRINPNEVEQFETEFIIPIWVEAVDVYSAFSEDSLEEGQSNMLGDWVYAERSVHKFEQEPDDEK